MFSLGCPVVSTAPRRQVSLLVGETSLSTPRRSISLAAGQTPLPAASESVSSAVGVNPPPPTSTSVLLPTGRTSLSTPGGSVSPAVGVAPLPPASTSVLLPTGRTSLSTVGGSVSLPVGGTIPSTPGVLVPQLVEESLLPTPSRSSVSATRETSLSASNRPLWSPPANGTLSSPTTRKRANKNDTELDSGEPAQPQGPRPDNELTGAVRKPPTPALINGYSTSPAPSLLNHSLPSPSSLAPSPPSQATHQDPRNQVQPRQPETDREPTEQGRQWPRNATCLARGLDAAIIDLSRALSALLLTPDSDNSPNAPLQCPGSFPGIAGQLRAPDSFFRAPRSSGDSNRLALSNPRGTFTVAGPQDSPDRMDLDEDEGVFLELDNDGDCYMQCSGGRGATINLDTISGPYEPMDIDLDIDYGTVILDYATQSGDEMDWEATPGYTI
ncbi:hypothetical protein HOY80DRAFT_1005206 [Tuber brumale]|nr:hypothetical protein HOY80DRAFT_1005206 [Tuber brumale]